MNKCMFSGRLTRDPEMRTFDSGKKKTSFTLVVNRRWFDKTTQEWKEDPTFLDCEIWDDAAERFAKLRKGDWVILDDCEIKTERWHDKETGKERSKLSFRVNRFEMPPGSARKSDEGGEGEEEAPRAAPTRRSGVGETSQGSKNPPRDKGSARESGKSTRTPVRDSAAKAYVPPEPGGYDEEDGDIPF